MPIPTNIETILNNDIVESVRLECKEGWNPESILHTICAFANDIDNFYGGYILIGIDDKQNIVGFNKDNYDKLQQDIVEYCKKCIEPTYIPVIDLLQYKNKNIVVLWCPTGTQRPYKCYENVYKTKKETRYLTYIRKGSLTIVGSRQDEIELTNLSALEPYDDRINYHYNIDVINKNLVEEYLIKTKSNLLNSFYNNDFKETLLDLKVIGGPNEDYHPKNIALLMFTSNPSNYIPYSYIELTIIKDNSGSNLIEKVFNNSLFKQFEDCMNYIKDKVIEKKIVKINNEFKSKTIYNYSFEVLEEIIANALLHKSYQIAEPVSIRIESDKIEVTSIPGFDRTIPYTAIKELKPKSKRYQYRRIAEFLKELNIVEAKNTGYPLIISKSKENSSPLPVIEMNKERDYVTVTIPIHDMFNNANLSLEERIIDALNIKDMSKTELSLFLGYKRVVNSISYQLNKLEKENKVKKINKIYSLI